MCDIVNTACRLGRIRRLAVCQKRMGRYDEAIKNYRVCVEQYPDSRFSLRAPYSMGLLYLRQKKDYEQPVLFDEKVQSK